MSAQVEQQDTHYRRGFAVLGVVLLVLGAGIGIALQGQVAEAGSPSSGSATAAAAKKPAPAPAPAPAAPGKGKGNGGNGGGNGGGGSSTPTGKTLNVSGTVVGQVAPGVPATLNVTIQNPNSSAVDLVALTATVTSVTTKKLAGLAACKPEWISFGPPAAPLPRIARDGSAVVALPVTFINSSSENQDNCKGVTYTFGFKATANHA